MGAAHVKINHQTVLFVLLDFHLFMLAEGVFYTLRKSYLRIESPQHGYLQHWDAQCLTVLCNVTQVRVGSPCV